MSELGRVHLIFAFIAIGAGAVVLLLRKGTRWHRTSGHAYAMAMIGVVATSFTLYDLTGSFGPFHFAAIVGGFTLAGGLYTVLLRKPRGRWMEAHAIWMSWSYIGLMAAFAAESLTRFVMPRVAPLLDGRSAWAAFWTAVTIASSSIFVAGWWLVRTRLPAALASTPTAMRRDRQVLEAAEHRDRVAPDSG